MFISIYISFQLPPKIKKMLGLFFLLWLYVDINLFFTPLYSPFLVSCLR